MSSFPVESAEPKFVERHVVTVSRRWDNPKIEMHITNREIAISMKLEDFITAVLEEMGNPTALVLKSQLSKRLNSAITSVVAGMKEETIKVI